MTANPPYLTRRQRPSGENHHLWNNHGTWWFHGTVHLPDHTSVRCRCSLKTGDPAVARRKRDRILSRPAQPTTLPSQRSTSFQSAPGPILAAPALPAATSIIGPPSAAHQRGQGSAPRHQARRGQYPQTTPTRA